MPAGQRISGDGGVGVADVGHVVHVIDRGGQEEAAGHTIQGTGPVRRYGTQFRGLAVGPLVAGLNNFYVLFGDRRR